MQMHPDDRQMVPECFTAECIRYAEEHGAKYHHPVDQRPYLTEANAHIITWLDELWAVDSAQK